MGYHLEDGETMAAGLYRIVMEQAEKLVEDLRLKEKDVAVHEARKRCKRIRAVVRMIRGVCPEIYEVENPAFRDLARSLSKWRDVKARDDAFVKLVKEESREVQKFAVVREALNGHVELGSKEEMGKALVAAQEDAVEYRSRVESWELPADAGFELLREGLRQTYKRGRRAMREAIEEEEESEEAFHDWRKRVKDLGYQMQILRAIWPKLLKPLYHELDELGDLLGDEHDLSVLREYLGGGDSDGGEGRVPKQKREAFERLRQRKAEKLRAGARELGEKIYAEKSRAFVKRIEAYWDAWRGGED